MSIASALVKGSSASPPPDIPPSSPSNTPPPPSSPSIPPPPRFVPSQSPMPPQASPPPFSHSPFPMAMVLPLPKDINVKDVKDFDGSPANLSMFDTQIENALDRWDIPAYYGGCVSGDVQRGFDFVAATSRRGSPNTVWVVSCALVCVIS